MKLNIFFTLLAIMIGCTCCRDNDELRNDVSKNKPVPIGDNSFVFNEKIYRIINNELLQIGDLNDTSIRRLKISSSELKNLGTSSLSFIKEGSTTKITSVYRGNYLYFKLALFGLNDLRDNFSPGNFTIEFMDSYDFTIYSSIISTSEMIRIIDSDGKTDHFEYNGKIEISMDAQAAITTYNISSSVRPRK
jgi:hypothetical protein